LHVGLVASDSRESQDFGIWEKTVVGQVNLICLLRLSYAVGQLVKHLLGQ